MYVRGLLGGGGNSPVRLISLMANLSVLNHRAAHQSSAVSFVSSSLSLDGVQIVQHSILFRLFQLVNSPRRTELLFFLATWSVYSNSFVDAPRHRLLHSFVAICRQLRGGGPSDIYDIFSLIISTSSFSRIRYRHSINIILTGKNPASIQANETDGKSKEKMSNCFVCIRNYH